MPQNIGVWFEIYVDDMERAAEFYRTVLATELHALPTPTDEAGPTIEMMSFSGDMNRYGANGALVKMEGVCAGGNSTMIYFGSEDCSIEESRVEQAGGKIMQSKMSIGEHGFISLAIDTEGNSFGIHSLK